MINSIIQGLFLIKIQSSMSEQEKKRQRIYDLLNIETKTKFLLSTVYKAKKKFLQKKSFSRKMGSGGLNKKWKEGFLTALTTAIKKDPTTPIRKHTNELKVYEKTVRTTIEQDLSPDLNLLDYAIWGFLENKTNATSYPNIGSLKTATEEEWNKMSEEFIWRQANCFKGVLIQ